MSEDIIWATIRYRLTPDDYARHSSMHANHSDITTSVNYGVASFSSWSLSICNFKAAFTYEYCILSKANTSNGRGLAGQHLSVRTSP